MNYNSTWCVLKKRGKIRYWIKQQKIIMSWEMPVCYSGTWSSQGFSVLVTSEDTALSRVQPNTCESVSSKGPSSLASKFHFQKTEASFRITNKSNLHTPACKQQENDVKGITDSLLHTCTQKHVAIQGSEVVPSIQNYIVSWTFYMT